MFAPLNSRSSLSRWYGVCVFTGTLAYVEIHVYRVLAFPLNGIAQIVLNKTSTAFSLLGPRQQTMTAPRLPVRLELEFDWFAFRCRRCALFLFFLPGNDRRLMQ